jgi:nitrite reductase (NADH) small subunit
VATPHLLEFDDVPEGSCRIAVVDGREIGIFKINGTYYGLANVCPHQQGPLCHGVVAGTLEYEVETGDRAPVRGRLVWRLEGEVVACPWHGLEVHVPTGRVLAWPRRRVRTYRVRATREGLVVWA